MARIAKSELLNDLRKHVDRGLIAYFYLALILCSLLFIYATSITVVDGSLRENLLAIGDMPDTAASVEVIWRAGLFGKVPEFLDGEYTYFGKFPILHALLTSMLNHITGDSVLSVFVLHLIVMVALVYTICFKFAKYLPFHIRIVLTAFLLANEVSGMYFPWFLRPRTELAVLFLAIAFLGNISVRYRGAMFFLAGICQPVVAGFCSVIFLINSYEKGRVQEGIAAIIGMAAASVFYLDLIMKTNPNHLGGAAPTIDAMIVPSSAIVLLFLMVKKKNLAQWICILGIASTILNELLYLATGEIKNTLFVWIPALSADLCNTVIGGICIFSFMFILLSDKREFRPWTLRIMIIITIFNLCLTASIGMIVAEQDTYESYYSLSEIIDGLEGGHVATMRFIANKGEYESVFRDVYLNSIAYVDKRNVTFTGTPIPPSYGAYSDEHLHKIANDIRNEKGECAESVEVLKEKGVTHLFLSGFWENVSAEELQECGLEEIKYKYTDLRVYHILD